MGFFFYLRLDSRILVECQLIKNFSVTNNLNNLRDILDLVWLNQNSKYKLWLPPVQEWTPPNPIQLDLSCDLHHVASFPLAPFCTRRVLLNGKIVWSNLPHLVKFECFIIIRIVFQLLRTDFALIWFSLVKLLENFVLAAVW